MPPTPHLHKLDQPKKHYDYDGLTGAWLWFPWWTHLLFAIAMWPLFIWLIPRLPMHQLYLQEYFTNNSLLFAQGMSAFCLFSASLSFAKAYFLNRKKEDKSKEKAKTNVKAPLVTLEKPNAQTEMLKEILQKKTVQEEVNKAKEVVTSASKVKTVTKVEKTEKIEKVEKIGENVETAIKPKPKKRTSATKKPNSTKKVDSVEKKAKTTTDGVTKKPAPKKKTLKKKADNTKKQLSLDLEN